MEYIPTPNRSKVEFTCLEDMIEKGSPVRFIEIFVEKLDLGQMQYSMKDIKPEGRPAFNPKILLTFTFMDT